MYILKLNDFSLENLIRQYVLYVSIFYSKDIVVDEDIVNKINDLQKCIKERISE